MTKKRGLGKGLGALIPPAPKPVSPEVQAGAIEVPVDQISPNPHQPRHTIHEDKLQDLANSIAEHGLIQPLIVTRVGVTYQLIAGERRWRACQLAGITTVPVISQLMEEFGLTQEAVAERVGKSRTAVANIVRLLNLPEEIKEALAAGEISEGHARTLLSLKNKRNQLNALETIIKRGLNVRQTETLVRQLLVGDPTPKPKRPPLTPHDKSMLTRFESKLGTRVELNRADEETGKVIIHFYSQEELQAIFDAILGEDEQL
jgi:ParB family chromosome partitioning protein